MSQSCLPPSRIPLFDPAAAYRRHRAAIDAAVAEVLASGHYIHGPAVAALEAALAAEAGARAAVAVANGTDALVLALRAAGIGAGDAVFVPAFTYVATAGAVRLAGAVPVFVDVRPGDLTLDPADLERRLATTQTNGQATGQAAARAAEGPRPRAVIAVDLYGRPADLDAIAAVAETAGLLVIADAAQSLGARDRGHGVAARAPGHCPVTATSFYPTKPLGCAGDGGMLFTDDPAQAALWRRWRVHGTQGGHTAEGLGMNSRLDTVQAAILHAKLPGLHPERDRRAALAARFDAALADRATTPPPDKADTRSAWALYTIRTPARAQVAAALDRAGVATGVYYTAPLHLHPGYAAFGGGPGSLPVAEQAAGEVLSLPCHAGMSDADAARVAEAARDALDAVHG